MSFAVKHYIGVLPGDDPDTDPRPLGQNARWRAFRKVSRREIGRIKAEVVAGWRQQGVVAQIDASRRVTGSAAGVSAAFSGSSASAVSFGR